jgi:hypothetical protein
MVETLVTAESRVPAVTEPATVAPIRAAVVRRDGGDGGRRGRSGRADSSGAGRDSEDWRRADRGGYSPHPGRIRAHDDVPLLGVEKEISGVRRGRPSAPDPARGSGAR